MLETGIRQFRMAMAMMWGWHINPQNVERMVADALKTLEEFGAAGDDVQQLLDGPFTDPAGREEYQTRMLQHTARRLKRFSPYYRQLFADHDINPDKLKPADMPSIPVTLKEHLQKQQQDFVCTNVKPLLATRTTGTTGQPAEIWLSRYEKELWPALAALSGLLRNEIYPRDCMQINLSSRATGAVQINTAISHLIGSSEYMLGIIPPGESLDNLLAGGDKAPTFLVTYPSYLAQLVNEARRRKLGPTAFRLRRIDCSGEVLSEALRQAAIETLGPMLVNDAYGMTEVLPVGGRMCNQGHLHHDLNVGSIEVIGLESNAPAATGELGTLVITPYYPYRECMPLFRYDTRDLVRNLPAEQTCDLAAIPATSKILGKASTMLCVNGRVVTMRDLVEVYEALPSNPWPARFSATAKDDHIEMIISEEALRGGMTSAKIERSYQDAGLDIRIVDSVTCEQDLIQLRPLRADLLETTFAARRAD